MKRILLDTDIGSDIDDALALLLALNLKNIEILGLTTVYGPTKLRAKIAQKIVKAAGQTIPIASGISEPFYSLIPIWVAGTEGRGVLSSDEIDMPLDDFGVSDDASTLIISQIKNNPGEVTIVALGALTNIAQCIRKEPTLIEDIKEIVFMGGGLTYPQNIPDKLIEGTSYRARSSHNILCDMSAAQEVINSGVPMRIITNDATCKFWLEGVGIDRFKNTEITHAKIVGTMLEVWLNYRSEMFSQPISGTCPHDALTLAVALDLVQYNGVRGTLKVDMDDAGTEFQIDHESNLELVLGERGNNFITWLSNKLHNPEHD